ncbi:hypothetical protein DFJ74DRAFT_649716 [Hyaloraphidium curvatum]|nr:hypothetical protein DFJ74DRAFT_649716 [Hyaloraphidium curvatum]
MPRGTTKAAGAAQSEDSDKSTLLPSKDATADRLEPPPTPAAAPRLRIALAVSALAALLGLLFLLGPHFAFGPANSTNTGNPAMSSVPTAMTADMRTLGQQWAAVRQIKGHWAGGKFNKDADAPAGLKKATLDGLLPLFPPGTPASLVVEAMGPPDATTAQLPGVHPGATTASVADGGAAVAGVPMMPGPALGSDVAAAADQQGSFYLVYWWRSWHDYVYFQIEGERVKHGAWYMAYE